MTLKDKVNEKNELVKLVKNDIKSNKSLQVRVDNLEKLLGLK